MSVLNGETICKSQVRLNCIDGPQTKTNLGPHHTKLSFASFYPLPPSTPVTQHQLWVIGSALDLDWWSDPLLNLQLNDQFRPGEPPKNVFVEVYNWYPYAHIERQHFQNLHKAVLSPSSRLVCLKLCCIDQTLNVWKMKAHGSVIDCEELARGSWTELLCCFSQLSQPTHLLPQQEGWEEIS